MELQKKLRSVFELIWPLAKKICFFQHTQVDLRRSELNRICTILVIILIQWRFLQNLGLFLSLKGNRREPYIKIQKFRFTYLSDYFPGISILFFLPK